jgi:hypothetical protein
MAPIRDERELYIEHTLDAAWIIILWHWIHGGDPLHESESAQTTELMARALVGHMGRGRTEAPKEIVEKLSQLGVKLMVKSGEQQTAVKTTKEFHDRMTKQESGKTPVPCFVIINGHRACWTPIYELFPPHKL